MRRTASPLFSRAPNSPYRPCDVTGARALPRALAFERAPRRGFRGSPRPSSGEAMRPGSVLRTPIHPCLCLRTANGMLVETNVGKQKNSWTDAGEFPSAGWRRDGNENPKYKRESSKCFSTILLIVYLGALGIICATSRSCSFRLVRKGCDPNNPIDPRSKAHEDPERSGRSEAPEWERGVSPEPQADSSLRTTTVQR
jgi:hypothetical protein